MEGLAVRTLDGRTTTIDSRTLDAFRGRLRGSLLRAGEPGFDEACVIWNRMITKRPALVARCLGTADVVECVTFARENGVLLSVKSGGHNVAGTSLCDGGLTIDLSRMRSIHVDPDARTARVQGGCLLGDIDRETQVHGLATVLGFVSETGAAGLTLGGGFGYLTRRFGLTVDNLLELEVVTADGRVRKVSATEDPDLFWALRGGGGNFGVVTWFTYRLHPIGPKIVGGLVAWPADQADEVAEFYRTYTARAPRELTLVMTMRRAPAAPFIPAEWHGRPIIALIACHTGPVAKAERDVAPIKNLGKPIADVLIEKTYAAQQSMLDATQPKGLYYYWKSHYLAELTDEALATYQREASKVPPSSMSQSLIFHIGDVLGERAPDDGSVGNRDARFVFTAIGAWKDPPHEPQVAWARETWKAMAPHATGGVYINFLTEEEGADRIRASYGPNYARLADVKKAYDPGNLFRVNKNIR